MDIGMITCNYFLRIYGYEMPESFDWGAMCEKYHNEFNRADFIRLAGEIRDLGYRCLEIWEPNFSHRVYTEEDARGLANELAQMGFRKLAYCIGGWSASSVLEVEKAYRFAKALGAEVVTGCISMADADVILPEIERCGKEYGLLYAIENHPAPSIEKPEDVARICKNYDTIGANLDTGIYNMLGYDVLAAADLLKEKVFHIHFKDTVKDAKDCLPIGDGDAPLAALLKKLQEWQYGYMISIEFEHHGDPAPGLKKSIDYINEVVS